MKKALLIAVLGGMSVVACAQNPAPADAEKAAPAAATPAAAPKQPNVAPGSADANAIEAELKVAEPEKRIIKVSIFTQDAFVMIRIENYCPWPVTFANGLPVTTKADRSRHGYGTASMLSIVEQYDGSLTMSVEDDWYVMRALIPHGSVG